MSAARSCRARAGVVGARARHSLWRGALNASGGLTVSGDLPPGGCVLVANHRSHADTAAILAAVPGARRPVVVAAADYWSSSAPRSLACSVLAAGVPVRRDGHGTADLDALLPVLAAGRTVVMYPEGTRSRDGSLGDFRSGAFRLAERAGVPVVPVALLGTADLLPVHGPLTPHGVTVRIGEPLCGASAPGARTAVERLAAHAPEPADSTLRCAVARLALSRRGAAVVALWAFAEALSFPLVPELVLALLVVAAPRSGVRLTLTAVAASLAGGVLGLAVASCGIALPQPLTTDRMHVAVQTETAREGAAAVRHQPFDGVPYKVYVAEAGRAGVAPLAFVEQSAAGRGLRILGFGLGFALIGRCLRRLRHLYPLYVALVVTGFAAGLAQVVGSWS